MENENLNVQKVIKIPRKKLIVTIFVIILLFILGLGILRVTTSTMNKDNFATMSVSQSDGQEYKGGYGLNNTLSIPISYEETDQTYRESYYPKSLGTTPSIEDTREFMKTSYNSDIKTRNVRETMRNVKSIINDADGRTDRITESEKSGYVSFVIPKTNFENFKNQIENLTNEKLLTENISSANLLNQKQNIEEQDKNATTLLVSLEQQKKDLTAKHSQTVKKLQANITDLEGKIEQIDLILSRISDVVQISTLQGQRDILVAGLTQFKQQLSSENSNYNVNNKNLVNQINNVNSQLTNIAQQDSNFTNNVETVNGYISVKWISLWQFAKIFSPIHPTVIIIILAIIAWYILKRNKIFPKVELI